MATKKTASNKSLKQLADSLPPAYELHRSGGEFIMEEVLDIGGNKTGKSAKKRVSEEVMKIEKEKRHEHPSVPKDCIVTTEGYLWKPHIYKHAINHYRRLRNAYNIKGMTGVTDYLSEIRKSQIERKLRLEKEKESDPTGDKLFGAEPEKLECGGLDEMIKKNTIDVTIPNNQTNEIQIEETLPNAE